MFGWLKKQSRSAEEIIGAIESAGIRFSSDAAREAVVQEVRGQAKADANVAVSILCAMGDEQFDSKTFELKPWLSNDVWHFDYEAIEDHGAYKSIVENCVRIGGADLAITDIADFVDVEDGKAWVEFAHGGIRRRFHLEVDNDWADPKLFVTLNGIVKSDGSHRRFAQHDLGQDCLIICRTAPEIADLNKIAGLNFRQLEG